MTRARTRAPALRRPARLRAALAAAALAAGGLAAGAAGPAAAADPPSGPPLPPAAADAAAMPVRGIVVRTDSGLLPDAALRGKVAAAAGVAGTGAPRALGAGMSLVPLSAPVAAADAAKAAVEVSALPGVRWAEADAWVGPAEAPPVTPDDPRFGEQWDLWDSASTARPGGWSVRAPMAWQTTTGSSSVVVAVVDTGITSHPDLNANVLSGGYDFVSDVNMANDGDGWDANPADPGDWVDSAFRALPGFSGCSLSNSSWHGTHVSGTVAAVQNNATGVSGVAPGARVLPVRVLGRCGGYNSDIAAAITWASGGTVGGVPANPTPARVINMSLGGGGSCSSTFQTAINGAVGRGTTVAVAAGNSNANVANYQPASCSGVIAVAATARTGARAYYSNYGTTAGAVALAAPGGDAYEDSEILSTLNTGTTTPGSPTYEAYQGTSMATPHVAAAAALLQSARGLMAPDAVKTALQSTAATFPTGVADACTTTLCGAGILDVGALLGPSGYAPLTTPVRLMDTRTGSTTIDGQFQGTGKRTAGQVTALTVAGRGGIPADAASAVLNVTAVAPDYAGFVTVYPCGASAPNASNVNFVAGQTIPNLVVAKVGTSGQVCIRTAVPAHVVVDASGYFPGTNGMAPLASPVRLMDTRAGQPTIDGQFSGIGLRTAGQVTALTVGGRGGVPAGAAGVVLNLTVTEPQFGGFVTVYPCGAPLPTASNVNFSAGQTIANAVVAKVGTSGQVCVRTAVATHVVVDASGYFPDTAVLSPLATPARLLDTRAGQPTVDGLYTGIGKRTAGQVTTLPVLGRGGIGASATTVVLNVTATEASGSGYVTVYPCGASTPTSSNLNLTAGLTIANAVVAKVGTGGAVCLLTAVGTHLVVDASGTLA